MIRTTRTYAELEISPEAYDEIASKLKAAGYDHAIMDGGAIDMHGIGLTRQASSRYYDDYSRTWKSRTTPARSETVGGMRLLQDRTAPPSRLLMPHAPIPTEHVHARCVGQEFGFGYTYSAPTADEEILVKLHADAAAALPAGTRYEVRKRVRDAMNVASIDGMVWYRDEREDSASNTDAQPPKEPGPQDGYILVGQFRTPPNP
jgi:hypothetical protein